MAALEAVLPYALVPGHPGVVVCGCVERWVSIYLQTVRGLNLAWGLWHTRRVSAGGRVAVVGGGFAGLAVAVALGRKGVRVTLFESHAELLATQRANRVRWIHPHIHEWPRPGSRQPRAGLPLLDWSAGLAADMAAQVLGSFMEEQARSGIEVVTGARVETVPLEGHELTVLALGVGVERAFGALPLASYWTDEDIGNVGTGETVRHHLVTGIGEGGVIDALYLRLAGFSHAAIADELAVIPGMAAVEEALLGIEAEVDTLHDDEANRCLTPWYRALPVPPEVDDTLRRRLRADTRVTLNGPEALPLAPRADILNRFLISRLVAMGEIAYLPGKITEIVPDEGGYLAHGQRFDRVNIRHGTLSSLKVHFPEIWERYQPVRATLPHLTPRPFWPPGFFT